MKVENYPIESVIPYARNPRKNDEAAAKVAASIKEFGWQQPIVVDADMVIIAGHTRLLAAQRLGLDEVPVAIAADLSPEQVKAFRIADNRVAQESEWDNDLLSLELADLEAIDFDLALTGFDDGELAALMQTEVEGLTDPDEVPEPPEEPLTVRGDIWTLGNHRLMCGDSTSIGDVDKLMAGIAPDVIHTDPPYGMNAVTKSGVLSANYGADILGDDNPEVAKDCFQLVQGLYPDAHQVWWGANYYSSVLPDSECWLVWDKNNGASDQTDCELAWANFRSVVRQFTQASEKSNRVHPTQKPVSITAWILKRFKLSARTIADFFGGSGSTLIAAEIHGADSFLMEFDPKFCDVIINRWQNFTGKEATLNGKTYNEMKDARTETSSNKPEVA